MFASSPGHQSIYAPPNSTSQLSRTVLVAAEECTVCASSVRSYVPPPDLNALHRGNYAYDLKSKGHINCYSILWYSKIDMMNIFPVHIVSHVTTEPGSFCLRSTVHTVCLCAVLQNPDAPASHGGSGRLSTLCPHPPPTPGGPRSPWQSALGMQPPSAGRTSPFSVFPV